MLVNNLIDSNKEIRNQIEVLGKYTQEVIDKLSRKQINPHNNR